MEYLRSHTETKKFQKDKGIILKSPQANLYDAVSSFIENQSTLSYIGMFDYIESNKLFTLEMHDDSILLKNSFNVDSTVLDFIINKKILSDSFKGGSLKIFAKSEKGNLVDLLVLKVDEDKSFPNEDKERIAVTYNS